MTHASPEMRAEARRLYDSGMSLNAISRRFGKGLKWAWKLATRENWPKVERVRRDGQKIGMPATAEAVKRARQLYDQGMSMRQIGRALGYTPKWACFIARRDGWPPRPRATPEKPRKHEPRHTKRQHKVWRTKAQKQAAMNAIADAERLRIIYGAILPDVTYLRRRGYCVVMGLGAIMVEGRPFSDEQVREKAARERRLAA